MSILFYRRPNYLNPPSGPIHATECARYVERAKKSERAIPNGLAFEEIINNKALPPCSLNDFVDYLVYIEHNAENLQFVLWYRDYIRRFEALPEKKKVLSPEWIPESIEVPDLSKGTEKEKENKKTRREAVATMMGTGYLSKDGALFRDEQDAPMSLGIHVEMRNGSVVAPSISETMSNAEISAQAGLKWQPFTIQPMREEISRVMCHYLAFNAPRELNLSHKDRALCLHALQHTTHPSALQPAVTIAEAALRGQSHPNFIRWSICNGNKPRVFFVRTMGVTHIAFGFIIAIVLTLSRASRWWRIFATPVWWIGISTMVASYKGLCVILHKSHARNLHPWEQDVGSELGETRRSSCQSVTNWSVQRADRTRQSDKIMKGDAVSFQHSSRLTFGPKNSFDQESWVEKYQRKTVLQRVFDQSTWTQDDTLRALQDKIVLGANVWALIITIVLTVVFVALPKGNYF